jgi:hypothetical protein
LKQISHFNKFLRKAVDLNKSRIKLLEKRVTSIEHFLQDNSVFGSIYKGFEAQGSWAHGTIIKPSPKSPGFDADVLLYLKRVKDWEAKDYVELLYSEFRANHMYKDLVRRNTRCVVVDYKGEFHIDVVPIIKETTFWGLGSTKTYVTNRLDNVLEPTNPTGYLEWFAEKSDHTNGRLEEVIRLAKYLRDIKKNFSAKSILLTTLLAQQIDIYEDDADVMYSDIPTALQTIFNRLDEFLQENETMPHIYNPSMQTEDFIRHWNEPKYQNFRKWVSFYTDWINEAIFANRKNGIRIWRKMFGDEFAQEIVA